MKRKSDKIKIWHWLLFMVLMNIPGYVIAQYNPNVLKAAYIERITRFVDWPDSLVTNMADSIVFGFVNDDNFEKAAMEIFKSQKIKGHPVRILKVKNQEDLVLCNLCYIGELDKASLENYIKLANQKKILLFGNSSNYADLGVHFNFYIEEDKLKFEINKNSTQTAGFKISHLLMKTARII